MRLSPHAPLPRQYAFLSRHSARSFLTYYTYDHSAAAFTKRLQIAHGLGYAPLHDMWIAKQTSVSGDAISDYPTNIQGIYQAPLEQYTGANGGTLRDAYYCFTDDQYVYIQIYHASATTLTKHVYFHVKLYCDDFNAKIATS